MKKVTIEEFLSFNPCWGEDKVRQVAEDKTEWTALEVLRLESVSEEDRLWAVLREEFIEAKVLHEFACRCAERALSCIAKPDPRSVAVIEAKRAWLCGEITKEDLDAAWADARDSSREAASTAVRDCTSASWAAAWAASSVTSVAWDARDAVWYAVRDAGFAVGATELEWQVAKLVRMLEKENENG